MTPRPSSTPSWQEDVVFPSYPKLDQDMAAAIAAVLIRDMCVQRPNEWAELYDPLRMMKPNVLARKSVDYTQELLHATMRNTLRYW